MIVIWLPWVSWAEGAADGFFALSVTADGAGVLGVFAGGVVVVGAVVEAVGDVVWFFGGVVF